MKLTEKKGGRAAVLDHLGETVRSHYERLDRIAQVFNTLDYFDGVNFAARATAPLRMTVALMDDVCPPSTGFAAYHHYAGPKEIEVWEYNGHEGGQAFESQGRLEFLRRHLA